MEASILDQTWSPSVYMASGSCNNLEDFVPMLHPTSAQKILLRAKNYPKSAPFRFYGYPGTASDGELILAIQKAAGKCGTRLKARRQAKSTDLRKESIEFSCIKHHHNKCLGAQDFQPNSIQQCGTIIQPKHQGCSVKGSSRSAKLKHVKALNTDKNTSSRKNKTTSIQPTDQTHRCPFKFYIFLSNIDDLWYLSYNNISQKHMWHKYHYRVPEAAKVLTYNEVSEEVKHYLWQSLSNYVNDTIIIEIVYSLYGVNISENCIKVARKEHSDGILKQYSLDPGNSSCDKLLQFFRMNENISFLAVIILLIQGFLR